MWASSFETLYLSAYHEYGTLQSTLFPQFSSPLKTIL